MKIALAQIAIADADLAANLDRMLRAIRSASGAADLMVFPETTLSGFPSLEQAPRVALTLESTPIRELGEAARRAQMAVAFGFAEVADGVYHNTALLLDKSGSLRMRYRKTHLWPHTDVPLFTPGDNFYTCALDEFRVGLLICYDVEFPETSRALAQLDVELILVLDGNMVPFELIHRKAIVMRAIENQCFALLVNRVGVGVGLEFAGDSLAVSPSGEVIGDAGNGEAIVMIDIDRSALAQACTIFDYRRDRRIAAVLTPAELAGGRFGLRGSTIA